jgi:hypothetical protein
MQAFKPDISILVKTGHFNFGLTPAKNLLAVSQGVGLKLSVEF